MNSSATLFKRVFILVVLALVICVFAGVADTFGVPFDRKIMILLDNLPIVLVGITILMVVYAYLEGIFSKLIKNSTDPKVSKVLANIADDIYEIIKGQINLDNAEKSNEGITTPNIKETISEDLKAQMTDEFIARIMNEYGDEIVKQGNINKINEELNSLERNISMYIDKLGRGSSINLVIGASTTITAVVILSYFVFEKQVDYTNTSDVLAHYIPRISIAIFVEIFSFFFLNLYKANLSDIKYFENERTNLNSKKLALKFAYIIDDKDSITSILFEFARTERNLRFLRDENNVNFEKLKTEGDDTSDIISIVKSIVKLKEK